MKPSFTLTESGNVAAALNMTPLNVTGAKGYGYFINTVVATPATKTFATGAKNTTTILCIADTGVKEIQTLTFPAKTGVTARDYIVVENTLGTKWAVYADKSGTDVAPTGAIYTAIPAANKSKVDISATTDAASVAAAFEVAFNALTGFTTSITSSDIAADGTMTFTQTKVGPVTNPVPKNLGDTTAGSLQGVQTTGGVVSNLNNTYVNLYSSPDEGTTEVHNVFWFNVNSEGTAPVVAGAVITAVALAAGAVNTAVGTALNAAIDATADLTSTLGTATVTVVNADVGVVSASTNGTASPGFTVTVTVPGTENSFSIADNTITIASHGFATGLKVAATTSAASFPTGLSATNYWVIVVGETGNVIKLAASAADALAGTPAINITGNGAGTHTLTPAAITGGAYKLQGSPDKVLWFDLAGITNNVTTTADFMHEKVDHMYDYVRLVWACTTGQIAYVINAIAKSE